MRARVNLEELAAILRKRICPDCAERTTEGTCQTDDRKECRLFELFPLVAQAILATEGDDLELYLWAIDENVCSVCVDQSLDGTCARRSHGCALDGRLADVVAAIEEAAGRSFRTQPRA
jgi:hypothetical protein